MYSKLYFTISKYTIEYKVYPPSLTSTELTFAVFISVALYPPVTRNCDTEKSLFPRNCPMEYPADLNSPAV